MHAAPAALRAKEESTQASHHRYVETIRHSLRDGLRLIRDLLGVPGLLATVAGGSSHASLIPASGDQDHTISPSAPTRFVSRAPTRPSHPAPRVVTIAIRPHERHGMALPYD